MVEKLEIRPHGIALLRIAAEPELGKDGRNAELVSASLTRNQKPELDRLAKALGVKVAWLVR